MVNRCVVYGCGNEPKAGTALHEFPSDKRLRELWKKFVDRTRSGWGGPTTNSTVCSAHFTNDCYENKMKYDMGHAKFLKLKKGAVPEAQTCMVECLHYLAKRFLFQSGQNPNHLTLNHWITRNNDRPPNPPV